MINGNFSDIATEMTNSVAKDGQSTLTGPLKASNGSLAAPALTFGSDTDTGIYRKGANDLAVVAGGAEIVDVTSAGIAVTGATTTGTLAVSTTATVDTLTVSTAISVPAGSVTTASIAADAVTFAKMQNISTGTLLGRTTAASGDPEQITPDSTLTLAAGALSVATPAKVVLISTTTASAAASLAITAGIDSTYDEYELHLVALKPATDNVTMRLEVSIDGGASWKTTVYSAVLLNLNSATAATSTTAIQLAIAGSGISNSTSYGWHGVARFWPNGAAIRKFFNIDGIYSLSTGAGGPGIWAVKGGGYWDGANDAVNAVRVVCSSGNITGTARLIGIKNS